MTMTEYADLEEYPPDHPPLGAKMCWVSLTDSLGVACTELVHVEFVEQDIGFDTKQMRLVYDVHFTASKDGAERLWFYNDGLEPLASIGLVDIAPYNLGDTITLHAEPW